MDTPANIEFLEREDTNNWGLSNPTETSLELELPMSELRLQKTPSNSEDLLKSGTLLDDKDTDNDDLSTLVSNLNEDHEEISSVLRSSVSSNVCRSTRSNTKKINMIGRILVNNKDSQNLSNSKRSNTTSNNKRIERVSCVFK